MLAICPSFVADALIKVTGLSGRGGVINRHIADAVVGTRPAAGLQR